MHRQTREKQDLIKSLIHKLGKSIADAARDIYDYRNSDSDIDDDIEKEKYVEVFKKKLQRSTTRVDELDQFIEILRSQHNAHNIKIYPTHFIDTGYLPPDLVKSMRKISESIDDMLSKTREDKA